MFDLKLSEDDENWLREEYPSLTITTDNGVQVVSGEFRFDAEYEGERISDTYNVRIEMEASSVSDLPKVSETGERIKTVAQDKQISIGDLHVYQYDWSACLCVKPAEALYFPAGFSFPKFVEELVVPFFYAQSYVERQGEWPWETYSHGDLGWIEWYGDQEDTTPELTRGLLEALKTRPSWGRISNELARSKGVKGCHQCMCGSRRKYRNCHKRVLTGFWKLENDMKRFRISKYRA